MNVFYLVGLGLGSIGVFQTILNGFIGNQCSLTLMALINSFTGFVLTGIYTIIVYKWPSFFPEILQLQCGFFVTWWYFVPAILGIISLIAGPLIMLKIGAFHAIIAILAGQIFTAFLWDSFYAQVPISFARIGGLMLTALGAYLTLKSS